MERFEEALEALDARVKIPERGYSTQYDKLYELCRNIDLIEQELGIPLEVLFKALREGIWIREYPEDEPSFHRVAISCFKGRWFISTDFERIMNVNCFKSAWGFTKEELE